MTKVFITYSILKCIDVNDSMSDDEIYAMAEDTDIPYDDVDVDIIREDN